MTKALGICIFLGLWIPSAFCYNELMHILRKEMPNTKLCEGLSTEEFRCKCDHPSCQSTFVSETLLKAYWRLRSHAKVPFKITSGYRCKRHNYSINGANPRSLHTLGAAVDIAYINALAAKFSPKEFIDLAKSLGFKFGYYSKQGNFIHLDVGPIDG